MGVPYVPDRWVVVKITKGDMDPLYKVFGSWYGGFALGDSWRMNSGIEAAILNDDGSFSFVGFSGSVYTALPGAYGTHMYGGGVIASMQEAANDDGYTIEVMPEDTEWLTLDYSGAEDAQANVA